MLRAIVQYRTFSMVLLWIFSMACTTRNPFSSLDSKPLNSDSVLKTWLKIMAFVEKCHQLGELAALWYQYLTQFRIANLRTESVQVG
mmetsp:Transcript_13207/g.28634  ORF Transcript_13207/g.28634 Transcript_13207/m.28634 type:complete len:87 (+) Transcript_13207:202-462(+)